MAALPLTGIDISDIATAIGVPSTDAGFLFVSDSVNEWGFNCPDSKLQEKIWGKPSSLRADLSPSDPDYAPTFGVRPGYHMGAFRGYDHNWVAYLFGGVTHNFTDYDSDMVFNVQVERVTKLEGKPDPVPAVEHTFKVEFARNINQFDLGTATVVNAAFTVTEPSSPFTLSALYPPDYATNGSLDEGEPFYIKVTHLSSPERRWAGILDTPLVGSYTTPERLFAEKFYLENFVIVAVDKTTIPKVTLFRVAADLYADFSAQQIFSFTGIVSDDPYFNTNVFSVAGGNEIIQPNTTPGTATFVKQLVFDLSASGIANVVAVGDVVYGRIVANTGQLTGGSTTVRNDLPPD